LGYKTDILVLGSGIAGLWYAIHAAKYAKVIIVTKKEKAESNTNYAQGGIASVMSKDDNFSLHTKDTLDCGAGLCHIDAVKQIVEEGPGLIRALIKMGADFSRSGNELDLGKEGGHSRKRIVHSKDLTGKEIERALLHQVATNKNIRLVEHHAAIELITEHHIRKSRKLTHPHCFGAYVYDEIQGKIYSIISDLTVICTGGIGQVYLHTTNPEIATGDGIAMAYRSGCQIGNMEFVQFHPTSLYEKDSDEKSQAFLISEAVRGAGAVLRTKEGKSFMERYDERGSLAPRDIVARAIDSEMKKHGDEFVYLDATKIPLKTLKQSFPHIYDKCKEFNIDISKDYIPVVPAAHYICGGIVSDLNGKTNLKNLYVLGESAMTGVHGANRLASNSLLEALVFADKAAIDCKTEIKNSRKNNKKFKLIIPEWDDSGTVNAEEWILLSQNKNEIKETMSRYVGIVRSDLRLNRALRRITLIKNEIEEFYRKTKVNREIIELRNMALISYLIIKSALLRKESRGLHYNTNYPDTKKKYQKDTLICQYSINEKLT